MVDGSFIKKDHRILIVNVLNEEVTFLVDQKVKFYLAWIFSDFQK